MCVHVLSHVQLFLTPWTARLFWHFLGKNTGMGCHFLLQGIFLTQESNLCLLHLLHYQEGALPPHNLGSLPIQIKPVLTDQLQAVEPGTCLRHVCTWCMSLARHLTLLNLSSPIYKTMIIPASQGLLGD